MFDLLASEPQYAHHLAPVWEATPWDQRGTFWTTTELMGRYLSELGVVGWELLGARIHRPVVTAGIMDYARARRAKAPAQAYMEHGCGQSYGGDPKLGHHPAYAGGGGRGECQLILAPNAQAAARWAMAYPDASVHVVGATRLLNPPEEPRVPLLVVSFHWDGPIPEARSARAHYRSRLRELATELPLAGHGHPRAAASVRSTFRSAGVEWIQDIKDVAKRATVYAVDNSSTLWEMGRTRPTIALNAPWYRRDVEHGLRFWSHAGVMVDDMDELMEVAHGLLAGEQEEAREQREARVAEVIPYLDGAQRASRLLTEWSQGAAS